MLRIVKEIIRDFALGFTITAVGTTAIVIFGAWSGLDLVFRRVSFKKYIQARSQDIVCLSACYPAWASVYLFGRRHIMCVAADILYDWDILGSLAVLGLSCLTQLGYMCKFMLMPARVSLPIAPPPAPSVELQVAAPKKVRKPE